MDLGRCPSCARIAEIKARLDEFDRHKDASMNERDPETLAYCQAIITIRKTAAEDERYLISDSARLRAELDTLRISAQNWKTQCKYEWGKVSRLEAKLDAATEVINMILQGDANNDRGMCGLCANRAACDAQIAETGQAECVPKWRGPVENNTNGAAKVAALEIDSGGLAPAT